MLLNTNIEIKVTNDGENNNVLTNANLDHKLIDILTSIELAKHHFIDIFKIFINSKYTKKITDKEYDILISKITLNDIFNFSQQQAKKHSNSVYNKPSEPDLLKLRFEVIANYPNSKFKIGQIIKIDENQNINYSDFPNIFKKLQWYEYRSESEMPKFLKHIIGEKWNYIEIKNWDMSNLIGYKGLNKTLGCCLVAENEYLPVSDEEYYSLKW